MSNETSGEKLVLPDPSKVLTYLTERRMCSAENLAAAFGVEVNAFWPLIESLQSTGSLRIAKSACSSSCDSCGSDCEASAISPTAIIISLLPREPEMT